MILSNLKYMLVFMYYIFVCVYFSFVLCVWFSFDKKIFFSCETKGVFDINILNSLHSH